MQSSVLQAVAWALFIGAQPTVATTQLLTDLSIISRHWGQLSPYHDNEPGAFGVKDTGLPDGCQVEQVHTLQRHAERFATGAFDDGENNANFAAKIANFTKANASKKFQGNLDFLSSWQFQVGSGGYLTNIGADTEFKSGVSFWNRYGRTLYNATVGQVQYNASFTNGTARPKPVLRTTSQSRIENSQISWALGFFGPSAYKVPDPKLSSFANGSLFDVVIIPEGGTENNTLASYDSCYADLLPEITYMGDVEMFDQYVPKYIGAATARMQKLAPEGFTFTNNDTYAMQSICAYETAYIGASEFCTLFTADEWAGFEQTLDIEYFYDYAWGNPTGRAQGIGYQQELIARLTNQYISSSNSSVNSTITNNTKDFPLGRPFYADFSHDDIIISVLTSLSIDYYRDPPDLSQYPPNPKRRFNLANMTPFGGRLITEVIGCSASNPPASKTPRVQYYPSQYGYKASNATHKFVRMRLNSGIVPLDSMRGGYCAGRTDGFCSLDKFVQGAQAAEKLANYDFCFANYTLAEPYKARDYDGRADNTTAGITVYPGKLTAESVS